MGYRSSNYDHKSFCATVHGLCETQFHIPAAAAENAAVATPRAQGVGSKPRALHYAKLLLARLSWPFARGQPASFVAKTQNSSDIAPFFLTTTHCEGRLYLSVSNTRRESVKYDRPESAVVAAPV